MEGLNRSLESQRQEYEQRLSASSKQQSEQVSSLEAAILDQNLKLSMAAHEKMLLEAKSIEMTNKIRHLLADNQWLKAQNAELQVKAGQENQKAVELQVKNRELERQVSVASLGSLPARVQYQELIASRDSRGPIIPRLNLGSPEAQLIGSGQLAQPEDLHRKCAELEGRISELTSRLEGEIRDR